MSSAVSRRGWPTESSASWPSPSDDRPIEVGDVEALVADIRPPSVNAVANAVERRDGPRAAEALRRAFDEGEPVLKIMAALESAAGRPDRRARPAGAERHSSGADETAATRQPSGRGADRERRLVATAGRELETMLNGLFEADLAIKTQASEPEAALAAWLGESMLGVVRKGA